MAKLTRFTMPVFAGNAAQTQTSVFGTMKTSPQYTSDVAASIGTTAYGNGWADAIEIGYAPYMEDMNTLQRAITYQIAYNQQQGIPEWNSDTEYYIGSLAKLNTAGGSQIYSSLVDNNVGNLLSDATKWKLLLDTANSYVTTNTTQTITGTKTFTSDIDIKKNFPAIFLRENDVVKGTNPQSEQGWTIYCQDSSNASGGTSRLGFFSTRLGTNGTVITIMSAYKNEANSGDYASIRVYYPQSGSPYATCPTPTDTTADTTSNQVVTVGWGSTHFVTLDTTQTISGSKTFTSKLSTAPIELYPAGSSSAPYIDFHYNGSSSDYTSRIIESASGELTVNASKVFASASDENGSIVTTVNKTKSSNGYYQLGNGLIIQWGKTGNLGNNPSSPTSTTLPKAFTSTNYKVVLTMDNGTDAANEYGAYVVSKSTTAFTAIVRGYEGGNLNRPAAFIAIGY